jgi:DNA-binding MarR family transcriptional regulator
LDFARLKKLTGATYGNLGAHIAALERADYVAIQEMFVDRKPRTIVKATAAGRKAFAEHVAFLKSIIEHESARKSCCVPEHEGHERRSQDE